ncbi:MAG: hypothetical protein MK179_16560 [Pirellulaceae bacterium]|nr:hypothetical protein [Pirellulaceae bacterium]
MTYKVLGIQILTVMLVAMSADLAQAQFGVRGAQSLSARIFSRPTVSPYLSLLSVDNFSGTGQPTYFTRVRPRMEARRRAEEQDRQIEQMQRMQSQINTVRRDLTQSQQAGQGVFPTGHPTRFSNYGHYYPLLSARR